MPFATVAAMKIAFVLSVLCLAACSKTVQPESRAAAVPVAPPSTVAAAAPQEQGSAPEQPASLSKERKHALMRAIFDDAYDPAKERASESFEGEGGTFTAYFTFEAANTLPDGRTAVIVNSVSLGDEDGQFASHGTPGTLNVYLLRHEAGGWVLTDEYVEVASMGSNGALGSVTWLLLGPGKPGFVISSGGMWQGYSVTGSDVFALDENGVHALGGFRDASSNEGACTAESDECWDIDSRLRLSDVHQKDGYRDLVVDFKGRYYTVTEDKNDKEVQHPTRTIRQTARYSFNGKEYVLVSGTNPVPEV